MAVTRPPKPARPSRPKRAADLKARLAALRKEVGAQENTPNPKFDAARHKQLYEDLDASKLKPAALAEGMRPKRETWLKAMNAVLRPKGDP